MHPIHSPSATTSPSCCKNGFAISSLPSSGEMRTRRVPLATISPRERVVSAPESSMGVVRLESLDADGISENEEG